MENTTFLNPRIEGNKLIIDVKSEYSTRQMILQLPPLYEMSIESEASRFAEAITGLIYSYARLAAFALNSDDEFVKKALLGADDGDLYYLNMLSQFLKRMDAL
ncbi:MAG: hypothetical protein PHP53_07380 [Prolixibacteraceae bacterium]|nr:hypothetical protein [Prolixibacteraceae bacterium]